MSAYSALANLIRKKIELGFYKQGQRLPSLRYISEDHDVSVGTAQKAYYLLEKKGLIESRPRSGYFVRAFKLPSEQGDTQTIIQEPVSIPKWSSILDLTLPAPSESVIQLGRGLPNVETSSLKPLLTALAKAWRNSEPSLLYYDEIRGLEALRKQIARLMLDSETKITANELIITPGCHAALSIAIKSICSAGDVVITDSPCFHGTLNTLRDIGVKVVEIGSSKKQGMSIEALELALDQWDVKAILITPNCNNPLGYIMPDEHKQALYELAKQHDITIVEDDIYGDLAYSATRPKTIKSWDTEGRVVLCSSFSKTLAPGLRIGWIAPGRYLEKALYQKYASAYLIPRAPQYALAHFIESGFYAIHLKRMRNLYATNLTRIQNWINDSFPPEVNVSQPQGSYILWVELPFGLNSKRLAERMIEKNIQIATGDIFSVSNKYDHCIRLNYGTLHLEGIRQAVVQLGMGIRELMLDQC